MRNLDQIIASLPPAQRAKVLARGRELIAEELALRHVRQARQLTQENLGMLLGIGQHGISKLESRSDMLISTLRSYVKAMGGSLKLVVEFPEGKAVIAKLAELGAPPKHKSPKKKIKVPPPHPTSRRTKTGGRLELVDNVHK